MRTSASAALAALPGQIAAAVLAPVTQAKAKQLVLDGLGCALAGASAPHAAIVRDLACELAPGSSTVIGAQQGTSLLEAVFANATLINGLDFDDTGFSGHPGASVLPVVLGLAEQLDADGPALLSATVAGYEACHRVSRAIRRSAEQEQLVSGNGTPQALGAALAAAQLLRLPQWQIADALGLAAAFAPLPHGGKYGWEVDRVSWVKDNLARAAEAGVRAALLAQRGFIGHATVLDGDTGFWRMAGSDRFRPELIGDTDGLAVHDAAIKTWPCCRWMHSTLEAAAQLQRQGPAVDPARIAAVDVYAIEPCVRHLANPAPASVVDAQFSLPHCLALYLHEVPPHRWHAQENLRDPAIQALAGRVSVHSDAAAQREYLARERPDAGAFARVVIRLDSGEQLEASADLPPTARHHPLPDHVVRSKFLRNAEPAVGAERAHLIVERVDQLERVGGVRQLAALLRPTQ